MTYDGANEAVYLDGQPNYFTTRALNIVKPVTISLGAWYDSTDSAATAGGTFNFGGISNIAEFRIHDDSFTAADAARNYAAASPIYRTSPWDASCPTSWTGFSPTTSRFRRNLGLSVQPRGALGVDAALRIYGLHRDELVGELRGRELVHRTRARRCPRLGVVSPRRLPERVSSSRVHTTSSTTTSSTSSSDEWLVIVVSAL